MSIKSLQEFIAKYANSTSEEKEELLISYGMLDRNPEHRDKGKYFLRDAKIFSLIKSIQDLVDFYQYFKDIDYFRFEITGKTLVGCFLTNYVYYEYKWPDYIFYSPLFTLLKNPEDFVLFCKEFTDYFAKFQSKANFRSAFLLHYFEYDKNKKIFTKFRDSKNSVNSIAFITKSKADLTLFYNEFPEVRKILGPYYSRFPDSILDNSEFDQVKTLLLNNLKSPLLKQALLSTINLYNNATVSAPPSVKTILIDFTNGFLSYREQKSKTIVDPLLVSLEQDPSDKNCKAILDNILKMEGGTDCLSLKYLLISSLIYGCLAPLPQLNKTFENIIDPMLAGKLGKTSNFEKFVKWLSPVKTEVLSIKTQKDMEKGIDSIYQL